MTWCIVFDSALRVAIFAFIAAMLEFRILVQARIVEPIGEIYLASGSKLHLVCSEGEPQPTSPTAAATEKRALLWSRRRPDDNQFVPIEMSHDSGFYSTAQVGTDGKQVRHLFRKNVSSGDTGVYRCLNNVTPSDTINVYIIHVHTEDDKIEKANDEARLKCTAHDPHSVKLNISWFKGSHEVKNKEKKYTLEVENGTLIVHKAGEKDIGPYTCLAWLLNGGNVTTDVYLKSFPVVKSFEKSQNINEGSDMQLLCNAWGWPEPNITWYRDALVLNASSDDRLYFANDTPVPYSHLLLRAVTLKDRAWYTCSATSTNFPGAVSNSTILVRIKSRFAALWPFLGICVEIIVLSIIISVYEKNRMKKKEAEEAHYCDGSKHLANCNTSANADNVRHRK